MGIPLRTLDLEGRTKQIFTYGGIVSVLVLALGSFGYLQRYGLSPDAINNGILSFIIGVAILFEVGFNIKKLHTIEGSQIPSIAFALFSMYVSWFVAGFGRLPEFLSTYLGIYWILAAVIIFVESRRD